MPFPILGAALAGGSMLGGMIANRGRRQQAQKDRDFQSQQAQRSMDFSERMRNTEWQAGVADMQAAGINPALAYSQGGASAPMGDAGSGSRADQQDVIGNSVSSAMQFMRLKADIDAVNAQTAKTKAETPVIEGRPGRVFTPAVDAAENIMSRAFSPRTMQRVNYEVGSSARTIRAALDKILLRFAAPTIGPNTTRRRR